MAALVRAASLTGYSELVMTLGGDPRRLLAGCGLSPVMIDDPDLKISADTVGRLLERTAEQLGAPDFGLRLAEARRPSNLGPVGMVVREQASLGQALEVMRQYQWLHNEALALTIEEEGDIAVLSLALLARGGLASRQATELSVAVLARLLSTLLGGGWRAESAHFRHSAPPSLVTHRRVLSVSPAFDQPFAARAAAEGVVTLAALDRIAVVAAFA
ncbi:MAG TPA: AraC family transcriptional regulator, partial [Caulobacter sp.]|nr:AraC family transcriptional regulator [Caulobacter sp.]